MHCILSPEHRGAHCSLIEHSQYGYGMSKVLLPSVQNYVNYGVSLDALCYRDIDRELILMKGHQQYMNDKLAVMEVSII